MQEDKKITGNDSTFERRKEAVRVLERSDGNEVATGKKEVVTGKGRDKRDIQNVFSDSNSEFERDDALNG